MKKQLLSGLILTFLAMSVFTANAQKGEAITPSFFSIHLGDEVYSLVKGNATLENIASNLSESLTGDGLEFSKDDQPVNYLHVETQRTIRELTFKAFREKLDIEINPLSTLQGKIEYYGIYPHELKFKKVLKKAPGEDYYLSYKVSMEKGGVSVGDVSLGGNLKPTTYIDLQIANSKGKVIQEFEIKEKTDIVVGKSKANVGALETGSAMDPDEVKNSLVAVYQNALDVLVEEYLKKNKKQYK